MSTDYATLDELKTHLRITDNVDDTELQAKLTAASRRVDSDCGRRFYLDAAVSTRTYDITNATKLIVDDFASVSGLVVATGNGTTWTTTATTLYRVRPENCLAEGRAAWVIDRVNSAWPLGGQAQITARWGWPAVPDQIKAATLLCAARLYRRKDSPEGTKGLSDLGQVFISRYDPDYDWMISNHIRPEV